jgi:cyclophilin family peptidyl-prolyl cis-trans isomerase
VDGSNRYTSIHTNPTTITNEPGISNLKGTIAMARVGGQINSATDQFFFNMKDNVFLDTVDQGFTVFGRTNTAGIKILEKIMKGTIQANATGAGAASFFVHPGQTGDQSAFSELPVKKLANFSPKADSTFIRRLAMVTQVVKGVRA